MLRRMVARKRPPGQQLDLVGAFYAKERRDAFARKRIELAEAGDIRGATAAQKQAEHWDREAKRFEARED
jgi:hypothetical protein